MADVIKPVPWLTLEAICTTLHFMTGGLEATLGMKQHVSPQPRLRSTDALRRILRQDSLQMEPPLGLFTYWGGVRDAAHGSGR
jgi:hypothetical protein